MNENENENEALALALALPSILVDNRSGIRYRLMEAIGSSSSRTLSGVTIYKAEYIYPPAPSVIFGLVAIMYVNDDDEAAVQNLRGEVRKNSRIDYGRYCLRICNEFVDKYRCLTFHYSQHGSLLSVMERRFPRGLPEQLIFFFLHRNVIALSNIHRRGEVHGQISAANIFVSQLGSIMPMFGYAASLHYLLEDQLRDSRSPYMPATDICRWAAAPLVDHDDATAKAAAPDDIWSIGITALELAYGGLRLNTREELESLVNEIHRTNKLPKNLNDDHDHDDHDDHDHVKKKKKKRKKKWKSMKRKILLWLKIKNKLVVPTGFEYRPKERVFSKRFVKLVRACLHFNPDNRPTATQLLDPPQIFFGYRTMGLTLFLDL